MPRFDPSADTLAPEDHACSCGALPTQAAPTAPVLFPDCTCEEAQPAPLHALTTIERDHGKPVAIVANRLYREIYRDRFASRGTAYAAARDHAIKLVEGKPAPRLAPSAPLAA